MIRRRMIHDVFVYVFRAPHPSEWGDKGKHDGLVAKINELFNIPSGSRHGTRSTMEQVYHSFLNGDNYDPSRKRRPNTTQYAISTGSKYEIMTCKLLEDGNPKNLTADLLSMRMPV